MELLVRYLDRSSSVSSASSQDVVKDQSLRDDLNFYFMNPCEKYQARQHIPWKLGVQILKIVLITAQLIMFGLNNQLVVTFKQENMMALKYLFVRGYSGADEDDYCTSVYSQQDAYQSLSFVLDQYSNLGKLSVGPINYADDEDGNLLPMLLCKEQYRKGSVEPSGKMYDIDSEVEKVCLTFDPKMAKHWKTHNASFFDLDFSRLVDIKFTFKLKTINLQTVRYRELPDCYSFYIMILFDNQFHSGKLRITLDIDTYSFACKNWKISGTAQKNTHYLLVFDSLVIAVCLTSAVLCARSMLLAIKLLQRFSRYLQEASGQQVCEDDQKEFLSGWYLLVIVSDLMAIIGSILKIEIQAKSMTNYDVCSIFLGTATLLVWVSAIRYLGYFEKYNVLILTMKVAFPKVLRFCCCAGMIYMGYTFCGWIVLGPYHEKFEQLNRVAECLFSLLNGDDMFATFALLKDKNSLVWYFSRAYLYTFISMFIYMVLSLFIGLITDSYEIVTSSQREEPNTPLHKFLREPSGLPAATEKGHVYVPVSCYLFGCCQRASVVDDD